MQFTSAVQQETFTLDLSDVDTSAPGKLRLHSSSHPSYSPTVEVRMAGNELCKSCSQQEWRQVEEWAPEVSIKFPTASDTLELEAIELRYSLRLDMNGRTRLQVFSATDSGLIAYRLTGLPEEKVFIVRIPAADSAISLIDTLPAGATEAVWVDSGGTGTQYFVCTESAVTTIAPRRFDPKSSDDQWLVRDLRSSRSRSEYLIVTHELFTSEAIRLAKHKRDVRKLANPRVVDIDDIFRQFAGGNRDPVALRNFLAHANSAWGPLAYVVLMGSGHFDYKGHFRSISETNFIPVIQDGEKAIDDFYGFLEAGEGFSNDSSMLDVFLGRIPCKTRNEAKTVVDKIVAMEAPDADFGAWRNRVLLVADDDLQGNVIDPISPPHYLSCEGVESRILNQRKSVEMSKIYLYDYPFDRQLKKPEVNRALVNRINSGVSVVNYFGHGADNLWSDEHIFVPEMVTELTNRNRYPIVTSFSCSVGRFDDPRNDCLSGMLVNEQGAGAIASIASTRVAYAGDNDALAKSFYGILFERNEGRTVGEALAEAKIHQTRNYRLNQRTYVLLGDPSIRMTNIVDSVEVRIEDEDGKQLDSLKALQQVRITGKIADGSIGKSGSAMIHLGLYNPVRDSVKRKDGGANQNISYALPGTPVFIGQAKLTNGNFTQNVLLPRSVTFREPGVTLIAYAWDGNRMATGVRDDYVFNGSVSTKITDEQGPRIMVKPVYLTENMRAGAGYREKISGQLPLQLNIELFDQSGIDVVGTGPDEGLTIELEEALERQNINHKFQFHEGDYRRGSATMQLNEGELEPGTYAMQVTAQDLVGNVEKLQMDLTITETNSTEDFRFEHVFNYPNPVKMGKTTRFYFHQTGDHQSDLEFTIRIFTLSGKMLRVIRNAVNGQVWDLTDSRGNRLAPNMYLYRVTATAGRGQYSTTTPMEKLVIHPPR
jgi:hypothetical protein